MKVYDQFEQYTPEYWKVRRGVPTCSEFKNLLTPTGKPSTAMTTYIYRLIADRLDPNYGYYEDTATSAMRNGTVMEPRARALYELHNGDVKQVGFCMTDDGRFGGSPDALVGDDGVLELKSPDPHTHVEYLDEGILPPAYIPQCHGHLIVTGRKWVDFMSWVRGFPTFLIRIEADDYTKKLREAMEVFWAKYQATWAKIKAMQMDAEPEPVEVGASDEVDIPGFTTPKRNA